MYNHEILGFIFNGLHSEFSILLIYFSVCLYKRENFKCLIWKSLILNLVSERKRVQLSHIFFQMSYNIVFLFPLCFVNILSSFKNVLLKIVNLVLFKLICLTQEIDIYFLIFSVYIQEYDVCLFIFRSFDN